MLYTLLLLSESVEKVADVTQWSSIAASLISTGFAVWYAWYMTTNRLPAIEKAHVEQLREAEQRYTNHIETIMKNNREDLKAMWDIKREDDRRLVEALDKLEATLRNTACKYPPGPLYAERP